MITKRTGRKTAAASAISLLALTMFAGTAGAQTVTELGSGSSDELVAPPAPNCGADALELIPQVSFNESAIPIDAERLGVGAGLVETTEIEDFEEIGPGVIEITEIITFDGHTGREGWPAQDNERVAIEFLLDGDVVVTTEFTPDVADNVNAAWTETNLGEYELPEGADAANIVHFGEEGNTDSVTVASLCAEFTEIDAEVLGQTEDADADEDDAAEDDADADDAAADDDDDAAADDDDDDGSFTLQELIDRGINGDTAGDGAAAGEGANGDELALTGANEVAFAVIALGVMTLGLAAKVRSTDPEDLTV